MNKSILIIIGAGIWTIIIAFSSISMARAQEDSSLTPDDGATEIMKKPKPIDIHGCWMGPMNDTVSGAGTINFMLKQAKAQLVKDTGHNHGSRIDIEYELGGFAKGPLAGKIKNTSITLKATFVKGGCSANGTATIVGPNEIQGTLDYTKCASGFGHVTYQVAHCSAN